MHEDFRTFYVRKFQSRSLDFVPVRSHQRVSTLVAWCGLKGGGCISLYSVFFCLYWCAASNFVTFVGSLHLRGLRQSQGQVVLKATFGLGGSKRRQHELHVSEYQASSVWQCGVAWCGVVG